MAVLSDTAAVLFDHLPASYGTDARDVDPIVARWLEALAFEIERIRALLVALRATTIPARADDTVGSLARWERQFDLPVEPEGVTVAQRRTQVLASLQGRMVGAGSAWLASMTRAAGTTQWRPYENTPNAYQLTLEIPHSADSYTAAQFERLARRRTPANLQIVMRYEQGFIVGVSRVGDAT